MPLSKEFKKKLAEIRSGSRDVSFANLKIGEEGAKAIATVLKSNLTLTTLSLHSSEIKAAGAQCIAEALTANHTLTTLFLNYNKIADAGAQRFAEALMVNRTLTTLHIGGNQITDASSRYIAQALKVNGTLTTLGLYSNHITDVGVPYIAEALKANRTLTTLGLGENRITTAGARSFAEALKANGTLTTLGLIWNRITDRALKTINMSLEANKKRARSIAQRHQDQEVISHRNLSPHTSAAVSGQQTEQVQSTSLTTQTTTTQSSEIALYNAAFHGDACLVRTMLTSEGVIELSKPVERTKGYTPLTVACWQGHADVVRTLLQYAPNHTTSDGRTSLVIACQQGRTAIVQVLLENQYIDLEKGWNDKSPVMIAHEAGHDKIARLIQEAIRERQLHVQSKSTVSSPYTEQNDPRERQVEAVTRPPSGLPSGTYEIAYDSLTLGECIGAGGFGRVYKGMWQLCVVAIKKLHVEQLRPSAAAEFKNEVQIMASLRHPHVVQLFGACLQPFVMVMEFMSGGSLYQRLHDGRPLSWESRHQMGSDIGLGLSFLHSQNILHRDLKSLNVLLDATGRAKLTDFGLSQVKTESRSVSTAKSVVGSLLWMAPELFERKAKYTNKSDVYALGIVLWELAARALPFANAPSNAMVALWVGRGDREDIPVDTPAAFKHVIERCWAQAAAARPTAEAAQRLLLAAHTPDETESPRGSAPPVSSSASRSIYAGNTTAAGIATTTASGYLGNADSRAGGGSSALFGAGTADHYADNFESDGGGGAPAYR